MLKTVRIDEHLRDTTNLWRGCPQKTELQTAGMKYVNLRERPPPNPFTRNIVS